MKGKTRLFTAAIMLALSLVMLAGASVAWMTVSTAPEISGLQVSLYTDISLKVSNSYDPDDPSTLVTFDQAVKMGDELKYYAPLKPVSTYDGVNWYMPTYTPDGQLKDPSEFILDDKLYNANVLVYEQDKNDSGTWHKLSGQEYFEASNRGYYVYTDFWLMTEEENGVRVTLSVPHDKSALEDWERGESGGEWDKYAGLYGSYALASYEISTGEDGVTKVASIDNNAQTCLRVGFRELTENGTYTGEFSVWEPNADQRSLAKDKPKGEFDPYVVDFKLNTDESNYSQGSYIWTLPIVKGADGKGAVSGTPIENLMLQRACAWDESQLQQAFTDGGFEPNSNMIESFGFFVPDSSVFNAQNTSMSGYATAAGSNVSIVELQPNEPKQIRMFIWLEGQDVDCWNDIASGSFVINLEFAAQSLPAGQ